MTINHCKQCLENSKIYDILDKKSVIVIIGTRPLINTEYLKKQQQKYEQIMKSCFEEAGLNYDKTHKTNLVKCASEKDEDPTELELQNCKSFLFNEIQMIMPKAIVTLGKKPAETMLKKRLTEMVQQVCKIHDLSGEYVLCNVYHPSYTIHVPSAKAEIVDTLKKMKEVMQNGYDDNCARK